MATPSSRREAVSILQQKCLSEQSEGRVWYLWSTLGLNLPKRRPRKRRCGIDIRITGAARPNSVWSYDFVHDQLANGNTFKMLCVLDEHTRECLVIEVGKSLRNQEVILPLSRLIRLYGKPAYIRSDNGAEFTTIAVMKWLRDQNVGPAYIKAALGKKVLTASCVMNV